MITFLLITISLTVLAVLGARYGADSRPVFNEHRESERFGALR